jgi:hypothetical protein
MIEVRQTPVFGTGSMVWRIGGLPELRIDYGPG